jgi:hypothetical protein
MLEPLSDLPDGVIGFAATDEIDSADYADTLIPAVEAQLAAGNDIRIVLLFESWPGVSGGAAWQDLKMGVEHMTHWKRIALVTDVEWMTQVGHLFGWMTPGEFKLFPVAERQAAIAWAASD